jgi:lipopolysaccharide/colanic/teichoic acid biosynthesis glycosyltransferase
LFIQQRTGIGGKRFRMYKFRTMVANADELKITLSHLNELTPPDFKITNDPRVTRVGHILRKTSMDELPQIINILKGEMSWVGPRPTSFGAETYSLWHTERLEVTPGLTGLWQVAGRSDLDFDERLKLDIEYIEKQNLWLDIRILFQTVGAVLTRKGAK